MWSHGSVYWTELNTRDPERAKRFYADTIGWSFESMPIPQGTYWVAKAGDQAVGGLFEMKGLEFANVPEHWLTYIGVDDVDARVETAAAKGASLVRPPFDIPASAASPSCASPAGRWWLDDAGVGLSTRPPRPACGERLGVRNAGAGRDVPSTASPGAPHPRAARLPQPP
jgi:predicted enzyme related to lactoylglutathione lyase